MKTLTVFTPTYNRKHTIHRTFESLCRQTCDDFEWLIIDDGSSDGTKEWVESLGRTITMKDDDNLKRFDWMGRVLNENQNDNENQNKNDDFFKIIVDGSLTSNHSPLTITYIYKPNGGLYTGYNVAYQTIRTELCVCIDSDDYMPDDAIEKILTLWKKHYPNGTLNAKRLTQHSQSSNLSTLTNIEYCGINGLDFNVVDKKPIGGYYNSECEGVFFADLKHTGDTKSVLRTDLMKKVAPMIGFEGEKNFNPIYMMVNVFDRYPFLLLNENLCWVEYQIGADSMSQGIFRQYMNSPRSFAKMRVQEMQLKHTTLKGKCRSAIHYVSSCIIAKDNRWLTHSPCKLITLAVCPIGLLLYVYIKFKSR